jgi:hypothetical protein
MLRSKVAIIVAAVGKKRQAPLNLQLLEVLSSWQMTETAT